MKVKLAGKWIECMLGLKPHGYTVDTKGAIYDRKLGYKFASVGEILACVAKLEADIAKIRDECEWDEY